MSPRWAKPMKTPNHLDFCNVWSRDWVAVQTAAPPQGGFEPETDNATMAAPKCQGFV
jgi:hypothetical protein